MTINITETGKEQNFFETSDLALATVVSLYLPIIEINKENPRRALFIFTLNEDLTELVRKYWNKELRIEPRQYFDQLKALKARLYGND